MVTYLRAQYGLEAATPIGFHDAGGPPAVASDDSMSDIDLDKLPIDNVKDADDQATVIIPITDKASIVVPLSVVRMALSQHGYTITKSKP